MVGRRVGAWLLVACAACGPAGPSAPRTGAGRPAPEQDSLRTALATYGELDRAIGAYAAASGTQIAAWTRAGDRLGQWARPVWARRVAAPPADRGAVEPVVPTSGDGAYRGEVAQDATAAPPALCTGNPCCTPSARPPPAPASWVLRHGHKTRVLRLDGILIRGRLPRPEIVGTATRRRIDLAEVGSELASAVETGDDGRAAPLAGLLLAELAVRQREAAFARAPADDLRPFDCGDATALLDELAASALVGARAHALWAVCLDLARRGQEARPLLARGVGGPSGEDLAWRLALSQRENTEPLDGLAAVRRLTDASSPSLRRAARVLASYEELRLSRYPAALADLNAAHSVGEGDAIMADLVARLTALAAAEWDLEVEDGTWNGGAGSEAAAMCEGLEVLQAHLRGSSLLGPALVRYADLASAMTMFSEAIRAYRVFVAQDPTSPDVLRAFEGIYLSHLGSRSYGEARAEALSTAAALAEGSPWQRANAGNPELLARARELVVRVSGPSPEAAPGSDETTGALGPGAASRGLSESRVLLGACLWGAGDEAHARPTSARLAVVIGQSGLATAVTATTTSGSAPVERCLTERTLGIQFPVPEGGSVPIDVWLVGP